MEDFEDILSYNSDNEEASYSDWVDSDVEAELYSLIHHAAQDDSISLQDKSDFVENKSVTLQDKPDFTENNSILPQKSFNLTNDNSVILLTNSVPSTDIVSTTKKKKNSARKNKQSCSTPVTSNTDFFVSDGIVNSNLYYSFESPVQKQKIHHNQTQSKNSKMNATPAPAKRKSDVISEILEDIQLKKNVNTVQPENRISKQKKNKPNHSSTMTEAESFVEVIDDSSDSDSSIMFLEPNQSSLQTNIAKETVVLTSDSENSDSSMEKSFSQACQRNEMESSNPNISPNTKDPWHINSEDKFRTRKQSNRYHENAVLTCSKCQLKGHSAKFCTVPKAMKCFFCGDYHSGMNCKNKICTKCFRLGHDRRRCYIRYIDTCELCRMRGHSARNCPDLWRRYHLTTSKGLIVKGNPKAHSSLYCYTCGSKGHFGAGCITGRVDRWSFPTWTSVISYKNPVNILRKENENSYKQNERSFMQEENNFHVGSRFDRTPLFHQRKQNRTFSKDTPTLNTKKKKKKKSKTPPNVNHQQSTPTVKNVAQNEVYFPRTPKMTSSSNVGHIPKKKLKKRLAKGQISREQQVMHRIGLHQRLGLPFPSTV